VVPATRRKLLRGLALALGATLAADQLVQWTLLRDGRFLGRRIAPYAPPLFDDAQRAKLEQLRARLGREDEQRPEIDFDAELGWCRPPRGEPAPGRACIVAVGDSFVFGDEVADGETWLALLGRAHPQLEFVNLGVGSYDLAQSLMRWRRDGVPLHPSELWVGFVPSQVLRNVTCYIPAWRHWTPFLGFKPRAEISADGSLHLVPCPVRSLRELVESIDDPLRFIAAVEGHDRWVSACPSAYAPFGSSPLHWSATARLVLTALERGGREPWSELEAPKSEVVELFAAQFRALAASGIRLRILILPDRGDLARLRSTGRAYWQALRARLEREGHQVFDASGGLLAAGADGDDGAWAPQGHYSPATNARVAELLEGQLR
jgi:hypothetical protein